MRVVSSLLPPVDGRGTDSNLCVGAKKCSAQTHNRRRRRREAAAPTPFARPVAAVYTHVSVFSALRMALLAVVLIGTTLSEAYPLSKIATQQHQVSRRDTSFYEFIGLGGCRGVENLNVDS
jgi:hypothetical protein